MKRTVILVVLWLVAMGYGQLYAQTNPSAVSLPFSLNSQSSATLPSGVAVHRFSGIQTTRTLSPANGGDLPNQGSSPALATGGWYHLGNDGIGLLASGTNPAGAVVVAINTTGLSNISVSWVCRTIKNQSSRDNSIALQYRVGTSGNFINAGTTSTYTSAGNPDGHASSTLNEVLPSGADNQAVVQVRWIYWESVSTSGSRDKISVDNISISGSGSCAAPAGLTATSITSNSATVSWNAASGAVSYEYDLSLSPAPPASGTGTSSTSYNAGSLNSATVYYSHVRSNCGSGSFSGWISDTIITQPDDSDFVLMTYNLLNYPGSNPSAREPLYRMIISDVNPDILVVQELSQASGAPDFLTNVMNYSSSSYSLGTFSDGPDTDNAIYYKGALFQFISSTPISTDLRDISQFKLRHIASGDTLIIYVVHLKASNTSSDEAQRASEVDDLRAVTNALPAGTSFVVCGDFNIYGDYESAYAKLLENGSNANGKFNDLLSLSGTWNNSSYAIHHTQSPRTTAFGGGATGGLDDRFDMILFSNDIVQSGGFDVVSGTYKSYGNDGQHYNQALNTAPYTVYSSTIASAIHDASDHLPVVVRMTYNASSPMVANTGTTASAAKGPGQYTYETSFIASSAGKPVAKKETISIYPNPANHMLFVNINDTLTQPAELYMYDTQGKKVHTFRINSMAGGETIYLNLSVAGLSPGIYYLRSDLVSGEYKIVIHP